MKKHYIILTGALFLVFLVIGCSRSEEQNYLGSGTLEADEVIVSSLLTGRLDSLFVEEGDSVRAGQIIALLDVQKLEAQLRQSQAALEELTINRRIARRSVEQAQEQHSNILTTLKRQKSLLQSGSSTRQIVDDLATREAMALSKLKAAQDQLRALDAREKQLGATIDLIRLQIQDGTIQAPISGAVVEKYVEAGENLHPGGPILKIADLNRMWIKIYLDERDVGLVSLDAKVQVHIDALPDRSFEGRVSWISPRAEFTPRNVQTRRARADLVFAVKVVFDNPDRAAMIGMPADVIRP